MTAPNTATAEIPAAAEPIADNAPVAADGLMGDELAPPEFVRELMAAMPKLQRACRALSRSATTADDLVQDSMVKALASWRGYTLGTNMGAWVCMVARSIRYSQYRREWRTVAMPEGMAEAVPAPASAHHRLELLELLEALQYLPAVQREAVALIMEGVEYEDAAVELGVPVGTIKSRVARARDALESFFQAA